MTARDDAIKAAARSVPLVEDEDGAPYPAVVQSIVRDAVEDGVLAAIPVLLAPIRTYAERCATATYDAGSFDARRRWLDLIILLARIEGGESR